MTLLFPYHIKHPYDRVHSANKTSTIRLNEACTAIDAAKFRVREYETPAMAPTASNCAVSPVLCSCTRAEVVKETCQS